MTRGERVKPRFRTLALLATLGLLAGACGGDDADTTAATEEAAATEATEATEPATEATEATEPETTAPAETTEATEAPVEGITVGLVYDIGGRGDLSFNDSAAAGLDQAIADLGIVPQEFEPDQGGENREELLRLASDEGYPLNFAVGFLFTDAVTAVSAEYPDIHYGLIDGFIEGLTEDSNVRCMLFAEEQGSFLVGVAAALKSTAGHIGFIGGVEIDLIKKFEAGYVAGATAVNPDITIDIAYLTQPPDFSGFGDAAKGKEAALGMYDNGADVVYHAAGGSGGGLFEAAKEVSESSGTPVWAIGVDSDQYNTVSADLQPYILTSMLKNVNVAVFNTISDEVDGSFTGGYVTYDLSVDGVGYSSSGGFVDDIADQLEDFKAQIVDGTIVVPTAPEA